MMEDNARGASAQPRTRVQGVDPDLEVSDVVATGDPRVTLLNLSRAAEMVVIGARGHGPLAGLLLCPVGVALARQAGCPVVVHPPRRSRPRPPSLGRGLRRRPGLTNGAGLCLPPGRATAPPPDRGALRVGHRRRDRRAALVPQRGTDIEREMVDLAEVMSGMRAKYPDVDVSLDLARGLPPRSSWSSPTPRTSSWC